ncbi:MAG: penicillin-binding protein 2 [Candidatus Daviesbacteria bacterium]|nr:MAG: penicillin-binding protein 2 [Candidatus Daviesbacteria bacterium]
MRLKILRIFFLIFIALIISRLFYWQMLRGDFLAATADRQHLQEQLQPATRGQIYFSDGSILASSQLVFNLYGLPKTLSEEQKKQVSTKLAKILANDETEEISLKQSFSESLSQDLYWVQLKKNIDLTLKKKVEQSNLPGIGFQNTSTRFYPEGSSSAKLLGFVGSDARGEPTGYFGIEGFYDGELRGVPGAAISEKDVFGLPILIGRFLGNSPKDGKNLNLNLDRVVQYTVEKYLQESMERYGAKAASAVVMEPYTGAILALAAYPNYDPLRFSNFPKDYYKNAVVADQYEPGSTFKVLVMSAAINEDVVKSDTKCDICSGPVQVNDYSIRTWDNKYRPGLTMTDVIIHSDNTGMVFTSRKLGLDKFYAYLQKFGFDGSTDIDLQDETAPTLRPKKNWREIDLATTSFGQGIAITPIQMVTAVSAIANGGNLMEPQVVKSIVDGNSTFEIKPRVIRNVISENAAQVVKEMMVKAVDEGEAKFAKPKGFKIAGKTGTAQIPVAGHYDPTKTIASFIGFAPADHPKFVMLVRFDQPSASIFGAETAAPTFFKITQDLFTYYKIAPEE